MKNLLLNFLLLVCCFKAAAQEIIHRPTLFAGGSVAIWALASIASHRPSDLLLSALACYLLFTLSVYRKARELEAQMAG